MISRPSTAAPILAVLAIMLVTLGAYVAGYLALCCEYNEVTISDLEKADELRSYREEWQCRVFVPAAWVESQVSRRVVTLIHRPNGDYYPFYSTDTGYEP